MIIFHVSDTYAYSIETLDNNPDLQEISQMEDEILRWAKGALEDEHVDLQVDYSRAVKIYVDTNIFENEELTPEILQDTLKDAVYIWEVPVKVKDNSYVTVTVSRAVPIDEERQKELLETGVYTEEELEAALEKAGSWTIPTAGYDETEPDYIGKLESALGEPFHQADTDIVYLLGGTPKMRQPFGILFKDGEYQIIKLNDGNDIQSFEQVKDEIKSIPTEDEELDTEETSVSENGNSQKIWVYGVGLLGVVLERKSLNVNEVYR